MSDLEKLQKREPLIHVIFWIIYFLYPFLKSIGPTTYPFHAYSQLNDLLFGMIAFYVSYLFIFPSKIKLQNGLLLLGIFFVVGYLNFTVHNALFGGSHEDAFLTYGFSYISTYTVLSLFAFVFYSIKKAYRKQLVLEEADRKKRQAELSELKAQINPHFLFNTLNTIYSSALKKEDKAAEMILKLSDSFRYILHEGKKDFVPLINEVSHLKDYIHLQEDRLTDKVRVSFSSELDNDEQEIAPLLLISFLENAFKYTSLLAGSEHSIDLSIKLAKKLLTFTCKNPFKEAAETNVDTNWAESGIGISNTTKRLDLLYPNNHDLQIHDENSIFSVRLTIDL